MSIRDDQRVIIKEQYKSIEDWLKCDKIYPIGSLLYIKGTDKFHIADGKNVFKDLTEIYVIEGIEKEIIKLLKEKRYETI